jgi:hypothetical protein
MNYALQGTAAHLTPRREEPLKRSGGIPVRPEAGRPSTATRTRRRSLSRIQAALARRRRAGGLPGPDSRESAGGGVSPIAGGASRGIALLSSR